MELVVPAHIKGLRADSVTLNKDQTQGSLTIQDPPIPSAGTVSPPDASITAENFSCTPASEKRSAGS